MLIKEKKAKYINVPLIISKEDDYAFDIVYNDKGHYGVVLKIVNPILQYSGDEELYYDYHRIIISILNSLGGGYVIQKQDIIVNRIFEGVKSRGDFLDESYFKNFHKKAFKKVHTYLTISKTVSKSLFSYNKKDFEEFLNNIEKVVHLLRDGGFSPKILNYQEIDKYVKRILAFDFEDDAFSFNSIKVNKESIEVGEKQLKNISVLDVDEFQIPNKIKPIRTKNLGLPFPVDLMNFLFELDNHNEIIYNQIIHIPNQRVASKELEAKKKKHEGIPNVSNNRSVEDIEVVMNRMANDNQLLVYAHFNIAISTRHGNINDLVNSIEHSLDGFGVRPTKNAFNQMQLFKSLLPNNSFELNLQKDFLKTTSDPAVCFFFKEMIQGDEKSDFQIYFSNRYGSPIAIDTNDKPMRENRINNRNKFVLGPSGSGKSFYMNHVLRQYYLQDTDIVIVDTGHSYSSLCSYYNGKYVTYTEEKPITMNPFKIGKEEYNEEKRQFLKSLISVIWKGADAELSQVEDTALNKLIFSYYKEYFESEESNFKELNFNSFYEYSIEFLNELIKKDKIKIDIDDYKFILSKFYKGGEYDNVLNDDVDKSFFDEKFIVFEIDSIKEHKVLFPIVTLIIMDVFIQKMRLKGNRKLLCIEEAWKALMSPIMAEYILFLYKTVRKFGGEAIVVTQELDDIIGNEIAKNSILNNSDTYILLDQSKFKDSYKEIAELLSLNDIEQKKIFTINQLDNKKGRGKFKEVYIKRGNTGEVYGVEVSLEEYLTYTTERTEKDAIAKYLAKFKNSKEEKPYDLAIKHFVKDFKKSNMSLNDFVRKINKSN